MPDRVRWCDGSREELDRLGPGPTETGTLGPPQVFLCPEKEVDAGPTNRWRPPAEMKVLLRDLFRGSMRGRTMYVVPFVLGPPGSAFAQVGVEITDSPSVAAGMRALPGVGQVALDGLGDEGTFVACLHSGGAVGEQGNRWIVHFPEERSVWSYGSDVGGDPLPVRESVGLRLASAMGRDDGWLAENMVVLGLTPPGGETRYLAAAFPPGCGRTSLTAMVPSLPGWRVRTVGRDIAWMRLGDDGRLWAVDPLAPGWDDPRGVPLSAILFGNRRPSVVPLVTEATGWRHGVFLGSVMASDTGDRLRRDPFAMLGLCGYDLGDHLGQWLSVGASADPLKLPRLFSVNWFRTGSDGRYLWPGFDENSRVLAWVLQRVAGRAGATDTPVGLVPVPGGLDTSGLDIGPGALAELMRIDRDGWRAEVASVEEHYAALGERVPFELVDELRALAGRLA